MSEICFDVDTCSEVYKEYIRDSVYGETTHGKTLENMIFIYRNKKYVMEFRLEFLFDFDNGFHYTYFTDFNCRPNRLKSNVKTIFENHIRNNFVSTDRLSQ
jgi:hypothetical protein